MMKAQNANLLALRLLMAVLAFALLSSGAPALFAADHREAPLVDAVPEGDITDVYVFTDPNDSSRVVMIMNVNPFSVPAELPSYSLSPDLLYQFKIDNTGQARRRIVILKLRQIISADYLARLLGQVHALLSQHCHRGL